MGRTNAEVDLIGGSEEVLGTGKRLNLSHRLRLPEGGKLHPDFTLQSAEKVVLYAEGWALWSPPWVVRRG
jgi:hypothetical protein